VYLRVYLGWCIYRGVPWWVSLGVYTGCVPWWVSQGVYIGCVPWWVSLGVYMVGIHLLVYMPVYMVGIHLLVYMPGYASQGTPLHPTAARCTAVHARTTARCREREPWAQRRRNPWVEERLRINVVIPVMVGGRLCAELPALSLKKDSKIG